MYSKGKSFARASTSHPFAGNTYAKLIQQGKQIIHNEDHFYSFIIRQKMLSVLSMPLFPGTG